MSLNEETTFFMMSLRILPATSGRDQTGGHTGPLHSHDLTSYTNYRGQNGRGVFIMQPEDTSHGFPKSNVDFKTCAPLNQRNSVHATKDTRHVVRSKIYILFYFN